MADKRGTNPNSRANLKRGNPEHAFNARNASEMGRRSAEAQKQYKTFREGLLGKLTPEVQDLLADAMIEKALAGDTRAYELIRDTMGEKPKDAVEVSGAGSVRFVFGSGEEEDDISG